MCGQWFNILLSTQKSQRLNSTLANLAISKKTLLISATFRMSSRITFHFNYVSPSSLVETKVAYIIKLCFILFSEEPCEGD